MSSIKNFELTPDSNTVLGSGLSLFLDVDSNDTTHLQEYFFDAWYDIAEGAFTAEAIPALWFYGSAVSSYSHPLRLFSPKIRFIGLNLDFSVWSGPDKMVGRARFAFSLKVTTKSQTDS